MSSERPDLSPREQEVLEAYLKIGTKQGTADALGLARSSVRNHIERIERKGHAPWLSPSVLPDTRSMGKTTVQLNKEGQVIQEWRRSEPLQALMDEIVEGICERVKGKGRAKPRRALKKDTGNTLYEIDIFDPHIGMYADKDETGDESYDVDKAVTRMVRAVEELASRADNPDKTVLVFGGDLQHADNRSNMTEKSHNVLDTDTRYQRVARYIRDACLDCVEIAASISRETEIIIIPGNHDWHSMVWLHTLLEAMYSKCPNVTVNPQQTSRKQMVWGDNLLAWSHGDGINAAKWAQIVAAEFPVQWGQTRHRHLKLGHIHHHKKMPPVLIDEQAGIVVEYLEALCPIDAWHAGAGYVGSQRGASAYEYHKELGLLTRHFHRAT